MCNGAKEYGSDRSRKMLKNEYLLAKFGVDTEENELSKVACLPPSPLLIKDLWPRFSVDRLPRLVSFAKFCSEVLHNFFD